MPCPESITGDRWTEVTARNALPILVWCAEHGRCITYGQLNAEIVSRQLGHHVHAAQYRYPAGAIGSALMELEERWGEPVPPLNAIVINGTTMLPGKGVNSFVERYYQPDKPVKSMSIEERRAVVEEVHADVFAYEYWDDVLEECELQALLGTVTLDPQEDTIAKPVKGGWSKESESDEHRELKEHIAKNPDTIGLPRRSRKGETEYVFASADKADVVFKTPNGYVGAEVKSVISGDADLNRGLHQAVKYQALLRAEQKAVLQPPTARAVLVSERQLPRPLQNLADVLGIKVYIVKVNG